MKRIGCVIAAMLISAAQNTATEPPWDAELEALSPAQPTAYFELAEEVADGARTAGDVDLARHLYRLAGALEPTLAASAALALADLTNERQTTERRRLIALAGLLDHRAALLTEASATVVTPGSAVSAAEALAWYRQGEGGRALKSLGEGDAMAVLKQHESALRGGLDRFLEDCELYTGGDRRPLLSEDDVSRMIRLEAALLAASAGPTEPITWSDALTLGGGEPLIEVDPDQLAATFEVDTRRATYRAGRWTQE